MDNVDLTYDDKALDFIVDKAIEYKLGARGLRGLMETVMTDLMYELPNKKHLGTTQHFTITQEYVEQKLGKEKLVQLKNAV